MSKKKFLFFSAGPNNGQADNDQIYTGEEYTFLRDLFPANHWHVDCIRETYVSFDDLYRLLESHKQEPIEILHFAGHSGSSELLLRTEGDNNNGQISIEKFKELLSWYPDLRVLIMNSCSSKYIAKQLMDLENIEVIVETTETIYDQDAILFSKFFYKFLSTKDDFKTAIQKTKNSFNIDISEEERGVRRDLSGDIEIDDDFPWRLTPANSDYRFVHPTIIDKIYASDTSSADKQIIFAYAENLEVSLEFYKAFKNEGYDQFCDLHMLHQEDILALTKPKNSIKIKGESIKFIIIISSETLIFSDKNVKTVLDIPSNNLKKHFVAVKKTINNADEILGKTSYLKDKIDEKKIDKFNFENITQLCKSPAFTKYLIEYPVNFDLCKRTILKFPCSPIRDQIKPIKSTEKYLRFFYAAAEDKKVINFIINFKKNYLKHPYPIVIVDKTHQENGTLIELLKKAVINVYGKISPTEKEAWNQDGIALLMKFLIEGHFIVFRLNYDDKVQFKSDVGELLDQIKLIPKIPATRPTIFFFNNKVNFNDPIDFDEPFSKSQILSKADPIEADSFNTWRDNTSGDDVNLDMLLEKFSKAKFNSCDSYCMCDFLELACEEFKVPAQKILKIS